jgi:ribosomal protein S18 acetylase RimI-like enzyme
MQNIDWERKALESEIEYSRARMSSPIEYPNFIHLYNEFAPWNGDFNRAVGVKISDFESFAEIVSQVEAIHKEKHLEKPNRFDIYPPVLDAALWQGYLAKKGYFLETAIFFCAFPLSEALPSEFELKIPSEEEYLDWYCDLAKLRGYYDEQWFQKARPLQINFISIFKPYWLMREGNRVGWVYCANLGEYARLFEVEISQEFRGQGLGVILLQAIRIECHKTDVQFVLLQSEEKLRGFYEKAGFKECERNSIIWLRE